MACRVPPFTRLDVEERRRRLLALGRSLFTRHAYDELSMATIAREAGISKALLYHYLPSMQAFFVATAAFHGWLWFTDGACLDWVRHRDLDRAQLHALLAGALPGAIRAAGQPEVAASLSPQARSG